MSLPAAGRESTSSWSTSRPMPWPGRSWRGGRRRRGSSTPWPTATSRPSSARWWTGRAPAASRWSRPARGRNTCPSITNRRRRRCGAITASPRSSWRRGISTPRCSTPSWTGRNRRSRWPPWPMRPASLPPEDGLRFPPCGADDLPRILKPRAAGGLLDDAGQVEVVSSLERDGRPVYRDLRWGVFVTLTTENPYSARCFREYGVVTDDSGRYTALYRPAHLIGLELGISVASVALRGEPTGAARGFHRGRRGHGEKGPAPGRYPGRGRRLHRLRDPPAGPQIRRRRVPPHRPRPRGQDGEARRRRRDGHVGRCRYDGRRRDGEIPPGDGGPLQEGVGDMTIDTKGSSRSVADSGTCQNSTTREKRSLYPNE